MNTQLVVFAILSSFAALIFAAYKSSWINRKEQGSDKMIEISQAVRDGAMAFLSREYKVIGAFVIVVMMLLAIMNKGALVYVSLSFIVGAFCSGLAGFFGMRVATASNSRTTHAARTGLGPALEIAFSGGSVMGMCVVGLGLLGLSSLMLLYTNMFSSDLDSMRTTVLPVLAGFSLGASSIALFARVGGGIYTKAADVGADLVGKVEAGIPEDDPRNPATIADNVGDNVGDVAGMGADLFESYVGSIVGAMVLGAAAGSLDLVVLPLTIAAVGILISIGATFLVRTKEGGDPQRALNMGTFGAGGLMVLATYPIVQYVAPNAFTLGGTEYASAGIFWATVAGLIGGILIGALTEFYTGESNKPVHAIAKASNTGSATNIIAGLGTGMMSTALPHGSFGHRDFSGPQSCRSLRHCDWCFGNAGDHRDSAGG